VISFFILPNLARADELTWLICTLQNHQSIQKEQIYAFREKDNRFFTYEPTLHRLIVEPDAQISKEYIWVRPFEHSQSQGTAFDQQFAISINRMTGAYFSGLPGIADVGSCSPTQPQPLDRPQGKF
jgi:hypothetical protein